MDRFQLPQGCRVSTRRQFVFFQKSLVLSQPWSQPWSNPMVLNKRPLDWESSTLTTRPFLHKLKRAGKYKILKSIIKLKYHWLLQYTNFDIIPMYAYLLYFLVHTLSSIWVFSRDLFRTLSNIYDGFYYENKEKHHFRNLTE